MIRLIDNLHSKKRPKPSTGLWKVVNRALKGISRNKKYISIQYLQSSLLKTYDKGNNINWFPIFMYIAKGDFVESISFNRIRGHKDL